MKWINFNLQGTHRSSILRRRINFWVLALVIPFLFFTCEKEAEKPVGNNKVILAPISVSDIDYFNLNVSGSLSQTGNQTLIDHGFCYGIIPYPDLNASILRLGTRTELGDFSAVLTNLADNKKYYIRAFATFSGGTIYTEQNEIITLKTGKPRISTSSVSDITPFTALCGGYIESDSGYVVTTSGICWDVDDQFDVNQCFGKSVNNTGNALFNISITGLNEGTTYYVKAYATNLKGISYGEIRQFSSAIITIPTLTTIPVINQTSNSVVTGGNITNDGNASVTARGVCWDTTSNPTLQDNIGYTIDGQGNGVFTSDITNLSPATIYYLKAYATNSSGTSYGNEINFQTKFEIGQNYGGGIIFYVDVSGYHGLIAAPSNQANSTWGCVGTFLGGTSTYIGSGNANSSIITNGCHTADIAARLCEDLEVNGYDDWFLPSKDELNQMYLKKDIIGGLINNAYWSSSESSADGSWYQGFSDGVQGNYGHKNDMNYIRAIRAF